MSERTELHGHAQDDADDFQIKTLASNDPNRTYLITYSKIDKAKFPTRESFGNVCVEDFSQTSWKPCVAYYACALGTHKTNGEHYHVSMLLTESKCWKSAKSYLLEQYGVSVHFQDKPTDDGMYKWTYISLRKITTFITAQITHPLVQLEPQKPRKPMMLSAKDVNKIMEM